VSNPLFTLAGTNNSFLPSAVQQQRDLVDLLPAAQSLVNASATDKNWCRTYWGERSNGWNPRNAYPRLYDALNAATELVAYKRAVLIQVRKTNGLLNAIPSPIETEPPIIVVSPIVANLLREPGMLRALFAHELAHLFLGHSQLLFAINRLFERPPYMSDILLQTCVRNRRAVWQWWAELQADQFSVIACGNDSRPLAGALLQAEKEICDPADLNVDGFIDDAADAVEKLINQDPNSCHHPASLLRIAVAKRFSDCGGDQIAHDALLNLDEAIRRMFAQPRIEKPVVHSSDV
jgi:Zn-dependent protease with chaperone function